VTDEPLADRLRRRRPVPGGGFRGTLARRLARYGRPRHRPARLRALVGAFAVAGALLLLIGALSAAGVGPLGA
jgi:hypothetical protein